LCCDHIAIVRRPSAPSPRTRGEAFTARTRTAWSRWSGL
jgi:hypothetical protein